MKYLLAVSALLLMASSASAQDGWTKEEQEAGVKRYEFTRRVPAGKPRVLEDAIYLNADCTIIEDIETTITKEPSTAARQSRPTSAIRVTRKTRCARSAMSAR